MANDYQIFLPNGGRWDLWFRYSSIVESVIKANKLKPAQTHLMTITTGKGERPVIPESILRLKFPGGIITPHLHFGTEIYLTTDEQWRGFTAKVLEQFQAKLAKAKNVSFPQIMELSGSIDTLV